MLVVWEAMERKYDTPKYIGKLFHDFRRSAADEAWKAGNSMEECKEITGHKTDSMFKRMRICSAMKRSVNVSVQGRASGVNTRRRKSRTLSPCRSGQPFSKPTYFAHISRILERGADVLAPLTL